jgi:VanZ family protein
VLGGVLGVVFELAAFLSLLPFSVVSDLLAKMLGASIAGFLIFGIVARVRNAFLRKPKS